MSPHLILWSEVSFATCQGPHTDSCWLWRSCAVRNARRNAGIHTKQTHMHTKTENTLLLYHWSHIQHCMFCHTLSLLGTVLPTQSSQPPAQFKFSPLLGGWRTYLVEQSWFFFFCCFSLLFLLHVLLIGQSFTPFSYCFILDPTMFSSVIIRCMRWSKKRRTETSRYTAFCLMFAKSVVKLYIIFWCVTHSSCCSSLHDGTSEHLAG